MLFCPRKPENTMKRGEIKHWTKAVGMTLLLLLALNALLYYTGHSRDSAARWVPTLPLFESLMDKLN